MIEQTSNAAFTEEMTADAGFSEEEKRTYL